MYGGIFKCRQYNIGYFKYKYKSYINFYQLDRRFVAISGLWVSLSLIFSSLTKWIQLTMLEWTTWHWIWLLIKYNSLLLVPLLDLLQSWPTLHGSLSLLWVSLSLLVWVTLESHVYMLLFNFPLRVSIFHTFQSNQAGWERPQSPPLFFYILWCEQYQS